MRSLLLLCLLSKALSVSCPWPLVYTTHKDVLENMIVVLCFCALGISIIYSFNLVMQHMDHPRRFYKADLAYQIPFLINICYIVMVCLIVFSPGGHLNNQYPAYCNTDESTLSSGDP